MSWPSIGPLLVAAGAVLLLVGLAAWAGLLGWLGHLPGDLRIERGSWSVYVPLASMALVSLVLSLVAWLLRRWFGP